MTRSSTAGLGVALALSVTAFIAPPAAAADPAAEQSCFRLSQMRNHKVGDPSTLYVAVGNKQVYRFNMSSRCLAGRSGNDPLILRPATGSDLVCKPLDLDIDISSGTGPGAMATPCIVSSIVKLTPAEIAALPPKAKP